MAKTEKEGAPVKLVAPEGVCSVGMEGVDVVIENGTCTVDAETAKVLIASHGFKKFDKADKTGGA